MEQEYEINFPIFGFILYIILTPDILASRNSDKYINILGSRYKKGKPQALVSQNDNHKCECYMFVRPGETAGTIAHEANHVTLRIMEFIDAKYEEEIVSYHINYITDIVFGICNPEICKNEKN